MVAALVFVGAAMADEDGPQMFPGDTAVVTGTKVACVTITAAIRCRAGTRTVTLSKPGVVTVSARSPAVPAAPHPKHLRFGVNGGFVVGLTAIVCHVYVQGVKILTCSTIRPAGGIPGSQGFDISDRALVVFRYGKSGERHILKTYRLP